MEIINQSSENLIEEAVALLLPVVLRPVRQMSEPRGRPQQTLVRFVHWRDRHKSTHTEHYDFIEIAAALSGIEHALKGDFNLDSHMIFIKIFLRY